MVTVLESPLATIISGLPSPSRSALQMNCGPEPLWTSVLAEEAAVTGTRTEPNQTILAAAVELKLFPVMVTVVLMGPDAGEMEVMTGWASAGRADRVKKRAT